MPSISITLPKAFAALRLMIVKFSGTASQFWKVSFICFRCGSLYLSKPYFVKRMGLTLAFKTTSVSTESVISR